MSILGAGGGGAMLGEFGLSTESFGLNLKGRSPQSKTTGSTLLTKTYAFELFATMPTRGAEKGILSPSSIHYFGLNPQQINFSDYSAGTSTYTAGGVVIEGGAQFLRQYTISGRSGVARRRGYSAGQIPSENGANSPARITTDGHRLFREMHKFFQYYSEIKGDPSVSFAWSMAFHDFINDDHYIINPRQFNVDRRAGGDYSYQITFDALVERDAAILSILGQIGPFADKWITVASTTAGAFTGLANDLMDAGSEIGGMIEQGTKTLSLVANEIKRTEMRVRGIPQAMSDFASRVNADWESAKEALKSLGADKTDIEQMNRIGANISDETGGRASAQMLQRQGQRAAGNNSADIREVSVVEQRLALRHGVSTPQAIDDNYDPRQNSRLLRLRRMSLIAENIALANAESSARQQLLISAERSKTDKSTLAGALGSRTDLPDFSSYPTTTITVLRGDTLSSVALRAVGDRRAGAYIAKINGLRYPYISEAGEPGTVQYSTQIIVPQFGGRRSNVLYGDRRATEDKRLYGQDLRLTIEGDLISSGDKTDLAVISGVENLKQAFEIIKLRTKLGSNAIFPGIGYPDLIGAESSGDNIAAAIIGARQCALADPRINSVTIEQAQDVGDGVIVALTCRAVNNTDSFSVGGTVRGNR